MLFMLPQWSVCILVLPLEGVGPGEGLALATDKVAGGIPILALKRHNTIHFKSITSRPGGENNPLHTAYSHVTWKIQVITSELEPVTKRERAPGAATQQPDEQAYKANITGYDRTNHNR